MWGRESSTLPSPYSSKRYFTISSDSCNVLPAPKTAHINHACEVQTYCSDTSACAHSLLDLAASRAQVTRRWWTRQ